MTDKELQRLKRVDLLELLISQSRENEMLKQQLAEAQQRLAAREIKLTEAGSIAEAALSLNKVFEAAQRAADEYLDNVKRMSGKQPEQESREETERLLAETKARCEAMEAETAERCRQMLEAAQKRA